MFETWAIGEALKARANLRLDPTLHYWRDKTGTEVDLLLDAGQRLTPIEFKSGQTVASDWTANLRRYAALGARQADDITTAEPLLVYGGDAAHRRDGIEVLGWRQWPVRVALLLGATTAR